MIDNYMLNKVLDKVKEITSIEKFDDTQILIDANDKLPNDIPLKEDEILIRCVVKDNGQFYPQLFWDHALLYDK